MLLFKLKGCLQPFPDWQLIQMLGLVCQLVTSMTFFLFNKDKVFALGCLRSWCQKEKELFPFITDKDS